MRVEIDDIDQSILGILQEDATSSIQDIADKVGLSANPCWRRIRRMEDTGLIKRRVAIVDQKALGLGTTTFVMIRTNQHDDKWLAAFAKAVERIPEIVECHRTSGHVDYLLKIIVRDIEHYDDVYQRLIKLCPGLGDVTSTFSMERLKDETAINLSTV